MVIDVNSSIVPGVLRLSVTSRGVIAVFCATHGAECQAPTAMPSRGFRPLRFKITLAVLVLFSESACFVFRGRLWFHLGHLAIKSSKRQLHTVNTCIALAIDGGVFQPEAGTVILLQGRYLFTYNAQHRPGLESGEKSVSTFVTPLRYV